MCDYFLTSWWWWLPACQAIEMLDEWTPIDTADALELLSKNYSADGVRQYAVRQVFRCMSVARWEL